MNVVEKPVQLQLAAQKSNLAFITGPPPRVTMGRPFCSSTLTCHADAQPVSGSKARPAMAETRSRV
ncbi:hypothetical protein D3C75_1212580 [compost metagenome]